MLTTAARGGLWWYDVQQVGLRGLARKGAERLRRKDAEGEK
jgi:hypothetical protein